ncbi:MAG: pyrroline-5-carboxylate reductase [Thermodesulfovibrionales bacterium]|nr:pyrroline-5-carboxylate reductase [Thermodesulfovibrionales bacterium]
MIGFIGGGNMAEALIKGMTQNRMKDIIVSEPRTDRCAYLEKTYGVKTTRDNKDVAAQSSLIILAVKPQNMDEVTVELAGLLTKDHMVVSIAAGITLSYLSARLRIEKIIRAMPNTPALVLEGMTVMSMCECIHDREMGTVRDIFMSIGRVMVLPEKYMDAVTAVSGSGPAYFAWFVEALTEAGEKAGLSKENAAELSIATMIGTAKMLETGMPPAQLREMVTSPGGTTAAGLKVFEEKRMKGLVAEVIGAAKNRSQELGRKE